ncbi:MAG: glycosyltransferase family 1 protein [Kiritimatiellia bacterium]
MKVLYDYQAFNAQRTGGVSRYFVELMQQWRGQEDLKADLIAPFAINRHLQQARRQWSGVARGLQLPAAWGPSPALSLANRFCFVPFTAGRLWDIYHPTYYNTLWPPPRSRRTVVTVFDMTHERFPEYFSNRDTTAARKGRRMASADGIICISEATRRDLLELTGVPAERTVVVPLATRMGDVEAVPFPGGRPYWLFVGSRAGYKDFGVLVEALAGTPALAGTDIVCFGGGAFTAEEMRKWTRCALGGRIRYVSGDDTRLRGVYEGAIALAYPSRYEGFGLPPLEAMTVGCPTLTADCSSLPEVVGDAGVRLPPGDPGAWSTAMVRMVTEGEWRAGWKRAGLKRAALFSWASTAAQTREFYCRVLAWRR